MRDHETMPTNRFRSVTPSLALLASGATVLLLAGVACSAGSNDQGSDFGPGSGGSSGSSAGGSGAGGSSQSGGAAGSGANSSGGSGGGFDVDAGGGGAPPINCNSTMPDEDGDGFTVQDGDCNDCDANANPGALDVPGNNVDEDCNGTPDDNPVGCDVDITDIADQNLLSAAKALGICKVTTPGERTWGVLSANWVKPDGTPGGLNMSSVGLLPNFGPNVNAQEGSRMLVLSSGTARRPGDPGFVHPSGVPPFGQNTTGSAPPGFPIDSPACPNVTTANDTVANDPAGYEIELRVPTNAKSFSFNFNFYTYEFPVFVCDEYNDFFVALQNPPPPNAQSLNISFDSQGNAVSVNNGFLEVCQPQMAGGKNFPCTRGTAELVGTGFDTALTGTPDFHAATGWLQTVSPVEPGSVIKLRFAIWDMSDHVLDSTVLIDNFEFSAEEATAAETEPVPVPQ